MRKWLILPSVALILVGIAALVMFDLSSQLQGTLLSIGLVGTALYAFFVIMVVGLHDGFSQTATGNRFFYWYFTVLLVLSVVIVIGLMGMS